MKSARKMSFTTKPPSQTEMVAPGIPRRCRPVYREMSPRRPHWQVDLWHWAGRGVKMTDHSHVRPHDYSLVPTAGSSSRCAQCLSRMGPQGPTAQRLVLDGHEHSGKASVPTCSKAQSARNGPIWTCPGFVEG